MATIEIAKGRIVHYDEAGSGPALIMLTGTGAPRSLMGAEFERLSSDFRVIIVDNRDAGENEPETEPYTIADLADDVAGLIRTLDIKEPNILGTSMGGFIALEFALRHSDLLNRLILVSTAPVLDPTIELSFLLPPPERWLDDPVARWRRTLPSCVASGFFDDKPGLLEREAERYRGNLHTREGRARQVAAEQQYDVRDRLSEITAPTLVLHGDQDQLIAVRDAEMIAGSIPSARLHIIEGTGHLLFLERPEESDRAVREFVLET